MAIKDTLWLIGWKCYYITRILKKMLIRLSNTGFNTLHKNKSSKCRQISIHSTLISWLIFCMSVTLLVFATDCLWFLRILTYHLLTVWKFRKFTLTIISLQNFREIDVLSSKINGTLAIFTKHFPSESNFMILNIVLLKSTWNSNPQREKNLSYYCTQK